MDRQKFDLTEKEIFHIKSAERPKNAIRNRELNRFILSELESIAATYVLKEFKDNNDIDNLHLCGFSTGNKTVREHCRLIFQRKHSYYLSCDRCGKPLHYEYQRRNSLCDDCEHSLVMEIGQKEIKNHLFF